MHQSSIGIKHTACYHSQQALINRFSCLCAFAGYWYGMVWYTSIYIARLSLMSLMRYCQEGVWQWVSRRLYVAMSVCLWVRFSTSVYPECMVFFIEILWQLLSTRSTWHWWHFNQGYRVRGQGQAVMAMTVDCSLKLSIHDLSCMAEISVRILKLQWMRNFCRMTNCDTRLWLIKTRSRAGWQNSVSNTRHPSHTHPLDITNISMQKLKVMSHGAWPCKT